MVFTRNHALFVAFEQISRSVFVVFERISCSVFFILMNHESAIITAIAYKTKNNLKQDSFALSTRLSEKFETAKTRHNIPFEEETFLRR